MRLQRLDGEFVFKCIKCAKRTSHGYVDLDGPTYKAYYCCSCGGIHMSSPERVRERNER